MENKVTDRFIEGNVLGELRVVQRTLETAEKTVEALRETKWALVKELKDAGHDFRATSEGMDVILSSSPSFNWN
jgi:hypothetical protein